MPTLLLTNYAKLITATQLPASFPSKHWYCIMFDNLSDKLQRVFKNMRGEGKLTPANMEEALREIRVALLEADVHFKVVKQFIEDVKVKAMGEDVLTALSPSQQVIKIVRDELTKMLGIHQSRLRFANEPPTVILIVGLQGSGKTTSTAKLARFLTKEGNKPQLVSVDVYRPAARHQLSILAKQINAPSTKARRRKPSRSNWPKARAAKPCKPGAMSSSSIPPAASILMNSSCKS
jgi:signal recognition particle GTPase